MNLNTPISETVCYQKTNTCQANLGTKFDDSIFSHSTEIYGVQNFAIRVFAVAIPSVVCL